MPDGLKRSRLLLRLDAEIAASGTLQQADCKRAERAAYLARLARFDEAKADIAFLQKRYGPQPRIEPSIWIHFAQGVVNYYENVGVCRTDHVRRAHALAVASGHTPLRALCAAWLALWDLSRLDMPALARHLREALTLARPHDHAALARAGLVAAQVLHTAGRADLARCWYQSARHHATVDGDDATLSALMHNMAWAQLMLLRQAVLSGNAAGGGVPELAMTLQSFDQFDQFDELLGGALWRGFRPVLKAQVLSLQGDSAGALRLYKQHAIDVAGLDGAQSGLSAPGKNGLLPRLRATLLADKAWCLGVLGRAAEARACADIAAQSVDDDTQIDDRAAAHSRLAQLHAHLGDTLLAERHDAIARQAWAEHVVAQTQAVELVAGIDPQVVRARESSESVARLLPGTGALLS